MTTSRNGSPLLRQVRQTVRIRSITHVPLSVFRPPCVFRTLTGTLSSLSAPLLLHGTPGNLTNVKIVPSPFLIVPEIRTVSSSFQGRARNRAIDLTARSYRRSRRRTEASGCASPHRTSWPSRALTLAANFRNSLGGRPALVNRGGLSSRNPLTSIPCAASTFCSSRFAWYSSRAH